MPSLSICEKDAFWIDSFDKRLTFHVCGKEPKSMLKWAVERSDLGSKPHTRILNIRRAGEAVKLTMWLQPVDLVLQPIGLACV